MAFGMAINFLDDSDSKSLSSGKNPNVLKKGLLNVIGTERKRDKYPILNAQVPFAVQPGQAGRCCAGLGSSRSQPTP